MATDIAT